MAFIPVPNTALVEVRMRLDSQLVENTLYFEKDGGISGNDLANLGQTIVDWWSNYYNQNMSNQLQLREVYVTDLTSQTSDTATVVPSEPLSGLNPSPALPNSVSLTISFRTGGRGRSSRGRNYVVGLVEAAVTGNTVETSYATQLVNAYVQLASPPNVANFSWVVVSRYSNNAPRAEGVTAPVTAVVATDLTVDSQRRRLPGRGK